MLQLDNRMPFPAQIALLTDESAREHVFLTIRATFTLRPEGLRVAEEQQPICFADQYYGEPGHSSLRRAAEIHLAKPTTDVVVNGDAYAPGDRAVETLAVSLTVGPVQQELFVTGDREWRGGLFGARVGAPSPFHRMPLRYERAFGGVHPGCANPEADDFEPRNPVGCGFVNPRRRDAPNQLTVPNLEHPAERFTRPGARLRPAGFGFVAPSWLPRRALAGIYDSTWERERAPFLPADYRPAFQNAANPALIAPGYLEGGEAVDLRHLSPCPRLRFTLPTCQFDVRVLISGMGPIGRITRPTMHLETVLLEPGEDRLSLLYRGAVPCGKQALRIERVITELVRMQPGRVLS